MRFGTWRGVKRDHPLVLLPKYSVVIGDPQAAARGPSPNPTESSTNGSATA
jgi:hypothetical protein